MRANSRYNRAMPGNDKFDHLIDRLEGLLDRVEKLTPAIAQDPDWSSAYAFRWRKRRGGGYIQAVTHPHQIRLGDLQGIDRQRRELERNTRQFLNKLPANNALLWGSRGTGKSSLVKALVSEYRNDGLRVLEVDKHDLIDLPDVVEHIHDRPERFLLFCDDLSFESDDSSYKALKAILDGSVHAPGNAISVAICWVPIEYANQATAIVASAASTSPRPPSRMPKNRPCSSCFARSATTLMCADQNVSPVAIPQPAKIISNISNDGMVENHRPRSPVTVSDNTTSRRGDTLSAIQPLGT